MFVITSISYYWICARSAWTSCVPSPMSLNWAAFLPPLNGSIFPNLPLACIHLLPSLLRDLRQRFPSLEIAVTTGDTAEIVRAIDDNTIDIGLVTLPAGGRSLSVTPLLDDPFVAVTAHDAASLPDVLTPSAIAALLMIAYGPGGNTRRVIDEWFCVAGVPLRPIMELGSVEAIKEMVGAGLGCAILPAMAVTRKGAPPAFQVRALTPPLHRTLGVAMRRDKVLHQGLREALRALDVLGRKG